MYVLIPLIFIALPSSPQAGTRYYVARGAASGCARAGGGRAPGAGAGRSGLDGLRLGRRRLDLGPGLRVDPGDGQRAVDDLDADGLTRLEAPVQHLLGDLVLD